MEAISNIKISNFKGIKSLSFSPANINIIVGKNNSYKTSVLEAINLCYNHKKLPQHPYPESLVNRSAENATIEISEGSISKKIGIFPDSNLVRSTLKEKTLDAIKKYVEESSRNPAEDIHNIMKKIDQLVEDYVTKIKTLEGVVITEGRDKTLILSNRTLRDPEIPDIFELEQSLEPIIKKMSKGKSERHSLFRAPYLPAFLRRPFFLHIGANEAKGEVVLMKRYDNWQSYSEEQAVALRRRIEEKIRQYELLRNFDRLDNNYITYKGDPKPEPVEMVGDGFKTMYSILHKMAEADGKKFTLLLDEPGRHMHMGYIMQLRKSFIEMAKNKVQIFLTTHNRDLIEDILSEELPEKEKKFLQDNLIFIKMDYGDSQKLSYKEAKEVQNELLLDLRGV